MSEAAGEDRAQLVARLYAEHGRRLYRYALLILADRGDAEDVIQQVFAAIVGDPRTLPETPLGYLRTAVRNTAYSLLRHRRVVRDAGPDLLRPAAPGCTPDEQASLAQALGRLPPEQREVVHLHVYEGLTFREVAEATGDSINTISARYRYALAKLRDHLT
jgi:RNA polymerase sigma-70 factor (ECF subfamily)